MSIRFGLSGGGFARRLTIALGAVALAASTVLVPVVALAAPAEQATPAQTAPRVAKDGHPLLERLYQWELKILQQQQTRLDKAGTVASRAQAFIDKQKEEGKDVGALQGVLAKFNEALVAAKSQRDSAQGILNAHAGFDNNGKVTDVEQARQTPRTAGKAERDCHRTLAQGLWQLRDAIFEYRTAQAK